MNRPSSRGARRRLDALGFHFALGEQVRRSGGVESAGRRENLALRIPFVQGDVERLEEPPHQVVTVDGHFTAPGRLRRHGAVVEVDEDTIRTDEGWGVAAEDLPNRAQAILPPVDDLLPLPVV